MNKAFNTLVSQIAILRLYKYYLVFNWLGNDRFIKTPDMIQQERFRETIDFVSYTLIDT